MSKISEETKKCIDQAERYLAIREHNCKELIEKLEKKEFSEEVIAETIVFLKEINELSEERYIRTFIRSNNKRHAESKSVLMQRLRSKGTDKVLAQQILDEIYTEDYTQECFEQAFEKISKKTDNREKQIAKLLSSGFSIKYVLNKIKN